jgi:hypothetical protein
MLEDHGCTTIAAAGDCPRTMVEGGMAVPRVVYRSCGTSGSTARTAFGGSVHGPLILLLFDHFIGLHGALLVNGGTC